MDKIEEIRHDTVETEKKYQAQQAKKRAKKQEKEELRGRGLAPLLLLLFLILAWLVKNFFQP